ncbi:MAG: glycosyltransferase, partial [Actinomycetota bacterium]
MTELWLFILVWGVWVLMPIIVDGVDTLLRLFVVLIWGRDFKEHKVADKELPKVTVLIAAYNEEEVIDRCLNSIKIQDYPHEKLEVVVINDGSTDATAERVMNHIMDTAANGNGYYNGYDNGYNGNGHFSPDGGTKNGKNGNARLPDGQGFNGKLPSGVYSTRDFKNGKNGIDGGSKNGTNGGTNGSIKNGNGHNGNGYLKINGDQIPVPEFNGDITLVSNGHVGKPEALNLGVKHMNHSEIVITIDSDVVLAPHAIRNMASAFVENPDMGAATGHIEISTDILEERDEYGNLVLDENGHLMTKKLSWWENLLAKCQFLEYLDAFRLGRQFQATLSSAYILAGAFSAFRRNVLESSPLYRSRTVSEDFDLTVDIHKTGYRVGYVADAKALLEPVAKWDHLYSQRVRWCRGQLEVCGAHQDIIGNRKYGPVGWFGFPQMLIVDHTLAFPRLIWTLLILLFPLFGYPVGTIALAVAFMYMFYVGLGFLQTFSAYSIVDADTKKQTEKALSYCFLLPLYRLVTFYFRMSGYLKTLKEPPAWEVPSPLNGVTNGVNGLKNGLNGFANGVKNGLHNGSNGHSGKPDIYWEIVGQKAVGWIREMVWLARDFRLSFGLGSYKVYHKYALNGGSKTLQGYLIKGLYHGFNRLRDALSQP